MKISERQREKLVILCGAMAWWWANPDAGTHPTFAFDQGTVKLAYSLFEDVYTWIDDDWANSPDDLCLAWAEVQAVLIEDLACSQVP